jgi:hypothetical protein
MIIDIKGYAVEIDNEDTDRVLAHSWWVSSSPEMDGHVICFSTKIDKKIIKLHRFIMGNPPGMVVDHQDGNRLNNRKSNLRICTVRQNNMNIRITKLNKSGYRGVSFSKKARKWRATISLNGKHLHLGYFAFPGAASVAYEEAAEIFYGDNRRIVEP